MTHSLLYWRRREKEYSLRDLERITGISRATLNRIENGEKSPTLFELEVIAQALECTVFDLFKVE